ncbi:aconitase, mitochondrial, putative [Talaromyces stipitatus ATCC 10500]|uniref:Aconitase, mitochondrial, putative n=1 Tax=Talaromyces stipitatus (strain ATCC 10500 / CBS 375.48 / QM 6759 / NRRL 1006) TaxID=441959 RepID=B8MG01_TALSN|nr:aconitase, mitochondrial, putative [Talaromyces stipitatus ATCC 10500]EED15868.1 aconitase, mitochondrial, putative [Talaromyces stipitatus ATCC 10500]
MADDKMRTLRLDISRAALSQSERKCLSLLEDTGQLKFIFPDTLLTESNYANLVGFLNYVASNLRTQGAGQLDSLADAYSEVVHRCTSHTDFGGYGFDQDSTELSVEQEGEIVFLCSAYLEAVKSAARARCGPAVQSFRPRGRPGMTMTEKILAMHDVSRKGFVRPGDIIQVDVDWVIASELAWKGMEGVYDAFGKPGIFRNDRLWLAGDHRVEPELYHVPQVKALMDASERAKKEFKMTDFQGFNYTILHTEFVRERAQPGMLVIGADSHTCSGGSVSCLAVGMGATDVIMPLVTGQTWLTVPETVHLRLINEPPFGVGGKDTVLYILKTFKRNTIAADRIVEFSGPGLAALSCDARFAIANMCTEFGAVSGIFAADDRTLDFVNRRRIRKHKNNAIYFQPDEDAIYAQSFEIDLSKVESGVAIYPSPDNVVPASEVVGTALDGCFIGACTTTEEDLIMAGLVLEAGLKKGLKPVDHGRRIVVPGSKPIRHKLEKLGLIEIYKQCGFKVGVPGCSMCVGQGVDQAAAGEKWLSSQNRNFKNRMGPGSIANLASAATVAASSFSMQMSNPRELLDMIDRDRLKEYLGFEPSAQISLVSGKSEMNTSTLIFSEPYGRDENTSNSAEGGIPNTSGNALFADEGLSTAIQGKVLRLGDFVDTDAIIPSKFLASSRTNEELGSHCMEFFMPEFRQLVRDGHDVVVAGRAFGCGSSRDVAVNALLGAGVKCVIAESFSFIYSRNQPNIGLLGIVIKDKPFFETACRGEQISVDLATNTVTCGGRNWAFQLSEMEKRLINVGGMTEAFRKFGKQVFDVMFSKRPGHVSDPATSPGKRALFTIFQRVKMPTIRKKDPLKSDQIEGKIELAISNLKNGRIPTIYKAIRIYIIPHTTLQDRLKGVL